MNTWPDGGMTPFRSEKNTNWEGAFRVPELIRWPGKIPAGVGLQRDRPAPRLAADVPRRRRRARHHRQAQGRPHDRRHDLQGPHRRLQPAAVPDRRGRHIAAQGVHLLLRRRRRARAALRQLEGRVHGAAGRRAPCRSGRSRSSTLRVPKLFNLRTDPFERADMTSNTYWDWLFDNDYLVLAATVTRRPSSWRRSRSSRRARRPRPSRSTRWWTSSTRRRSPRADERSPSWNDGPARTAILLPRADHGRAAGPRPPRRADRRFDNDGTLWCEKPGLHRRRCSSSSGWASRPRRDPELAAQPVVQALLGGDLAARRQRGRRWPRCCSSTHAG